MSRHVHNWFEIQRVFTPPTNSLKNFTSSGRSAALAMEMVQKDLYGFTSVEMQCKGCGDIQFVQEHGDQRRKDLQYTPGIIVPAATTGDGAGGKVTWPA